MVNDLVLTTTAIRKNLSHFRDSILLNWHIVVHLNAQASPLNRLFHNLECQEWYFLIARIHNSLRHLLNHFLITLLILIRHECRVHDIIDCLVQSIVDLLQILTHSSEFRGKCLLRVSHIEESLRCSIDKVILLPDREDIPLQTESFKCFRTNAFNWEIQLILDFRMNFSILLE